MQPRPSALRVLCRKVCVGASLLVAAAAVVRWQGAPSPEVHAARSGPGALAAERPQATAGPLPAEPPLQPATPGADRMPRRPVATYSIVARDPDTGELGVAVQSHWFSVGPVVPWAEAGVGAVATQSFVRIDYGPDGLQAMRAGEEPGQALARLLAADPQADVRQVAFVDAQGRTAAHTGARCIQAAGHHTGAGYSVQANLMERESVWPAMAAAFEAADGPLAERLLAALAAAEREGGDIRGRQSAALLVVSGEKASRPHEGRLVDLRVEDDPDPVGELNRLLRLHRAYERMDRGDALFAVQDVTGAMTEYEAALQLAPENYEIAFWSGITLAGAGRLAAGATLVQRAFVGEPRLRELVPRLPASGLLPDEPQLIARLLGDAAAPGPSR